jgi:hypothetical protein
MESMASQKNITDEARARAEARFQVHEQRKTDAEKAMRDIQDAQVAERAKTIRLRALRLAKEEADREVAALPELKGKGKAKAKAAKSAPTRRNVAS